MLGVGAEPFLVQLVDGAIGFKLSDSVIDGGSEVRVVFADRNAVLLARGDFFYDLAIGVGDFDVVVGNRFVENDGGNLAGLKGRKDCGIFVECDDFLGVSQVLLGPVKAGGSGFGSRCACLPSWIRR